MLYLVNYFSRNRGKTAGIERNSASGDIYESVVYYAPEQGSEKVYNTRPRGEWGTLMFWADNDTQAFAIVRATLNKPVSGHTYLPTCRVSEERVSEMLATANGNG